MRIYLISDCGTGFVSYGWAGGENDNTPIDFDPPFLLSSVEVERDGNSPYIEVPDEQINEAIGKFVEWKDGIHFTVGIA